MSFERVVRLFCDHCYAECETDCFSARLARKYAYEESGWERKYNRTTCRTEDVCFDCSRKGGENNDDD